MKLAYFACAFGRHSIDTARVRKVFGRNVSRCTHCSTPMEEEFPHSWVVQHARDAGLGYRLDR